MLTPKELSIIEKIEWKNKTKIIGSCERKIRLLELEIRLQTRIEHLINDCMKKEFKGEVCDDDVIHILENIIKKYQK